MDPKLLLKFKELVDKELPGFDNFDGKYQAKIDKEREPKLKIEGQVPSLRKLKSKKDIGEGFYNLVSKNRIYVNPHINTRIKKLKDGNKKEYSKFCEMLGDVLSNSKTDKETFSKSIDDYITFRAKFKVIDKALFDILPAQGAVIILILVAMSMKDNSNTIMGNIKFFGIISEFFEHPKIFEDKSKNLESEYEWLSSLIESLYKAMKIEWNWQPRDLLDVQCILWIILKEKKKDGKDDQPANNIAVGDDPKVGQPKNLVFYGPPGTGKTYQTSEEAVIICDDKEFKDRNEYMERYRELTEQGRVKFVTFHQSFSYEDFIEGRQPKTEETRTGGGFSLEVVDGILKKIARVALKDKHNPYVLIIDEINRGNISKVFGELITLIEPDKRLGANNELKVRLPYSGDEFGLPSNIHFIGTMNTADRSIAQVDIALRRRFEFIEILPNPRIITNGLSDAEQQSLKDSLDGIELKDILKTLNQRIEYFEGRERQIGHSYFMGCKNKDDVDKVMRSRVVPLLAEYFFEDWSKVKATLGKASGDFLDEEELVCPPDYNEDYEKRYRYSLQQHEYPKDVYRKLIG